MQRFTATSEILDPPQYLGGVDIYDVFYWAAAYEGRERLVVKWSDHGGAFYYWDFNSECWRNCYSVHIDKDRITKEQTETILAMYQCFAIKPEGKADAAV